MKPTAHLCLVLRSRMNGAIHLPIHFHDVHRDSFTLIYLIMFHRHKSLCYCEMDASVEQRYISGLRMGVTKVFHSDMSLNNQTSLRQVSQFTS